ncbi:unnamed protein product [Pleuronectes platessa]|uniref:Obg-like ATPase 1 n=1 Tax=Pleuronectes platessa TaxID=8262 RepID=A0A9N7Y3V9_PLEPL|nr:unnamed protein product [Pleuronectes platessa]
MRKSTFFNVLTKSQAAAENFPFCTIDPNESRVPIPDERYDFLCQFHKPAREIPAFLNVVDIAGLLKGAHSGQGLGNAFLSHISACDGIFHLTRAFEDEDIIHVEGTVDPVRDMEIIHEELRLKDEEMIGPVIDKLEKTAIRGVDKKLKPEYDVMCKIKSWVVDEKKHVRYYPDWNDNETPMCNAIPPGHGRREQGASALLSLRSSPLASSPPKHARPCNLAPGTQRGPTGLLLTESVPAMHRCATVCDSGSGVGSLTCWFVRGCRLVKIKAWVDSHDPGALVIPFSGGLESQLQDASDEDRQKHCTEHKTQSGDKEYLNSSYPLIRAGSSVSTSALCRIIRAGYAALQLEYFFTAGPDEVRAWTVRKGTKAPQAAGKIHTDFERGFITAEVMKFQDFKEEGSENSVKASGKYRQQGRNYVVEDGDIIFFKFNAPNAPKKK